MFIGVNGAVTDGRPAASKGQLEICHLKQADICPSSRNGNLDHRISISVRFLMPSPSVYSFLDILGCELSQNHVTIFGKLN